MPAIDFPINPGLNLEYTNGVNTYKWNGTSWRLIRTSAVGPVGPTGPQGEDSTVVGPTGATGPEVTGPTGAASTEVGPIGPTGPTGSFGISPWTTYTPQWTAASTNPTIGDSSIVGRYVNLGATVIGQIIITCGSAGGGFLRGSGAYTFSLPTNAVAASYQPLGQVVIRDEGPATQYFGTAIFGIISSGTSTTFQAFMHGQNSAFDEGLPASDTVPFALSVNDKIIIQFTYEAFLG